MSTTGHETEAINVRGLKASLKKGGNIGIFNECICSTAGGTAAKVTNTVPPSFSLVSGAKIIVKFTYAITVANATLQVGETAAKPIRIMGAALDANIIKAGTSVLLSYDGTAYNIIGGVGGNDVDVNYDTTNKKITKTINGMTSDVVTAETLATDGGAVIEPEVEIGETAPTGTPKLFVDEDADPEVSIDVYTRAQTDAMLAGKADEATTLNGYGITDAYTKTQIDALTRHTRLTDFDLNVLKQAVADQNLEKYGLKVGDEKTINGHTYVIADLNTMKGTTTPYRVTTNHVGLIVIPHTTQKWNASGNTSTGADGRGAGYMNSDLHYYLKNTLLPLVETDLGADNLLGHSKLLSNAVTDGKSSSWNWETGCKICVLSEVQVYGSTVCGSSSYDTGEACRQLEVFQHYSHTEIFGDKHLWLRNVVSASDTAYIHSGGAASYDDVSKDNFVAALILFH